MDCNLCPSRPPFCLIVHSRFPSNNTTLKFYRLYHDTSRPLDFSRPVHTEILISIIYTALNQNPSCHLYISRVVRHKTCRFDVWVSEYLCWTHKCYDFHVCQSQKALWHLLLCLSALKRLDVVRELLRVGEVGVGRVEMNVNQQRLPWVTF
jgi:hypothetical protein